MKAKNIFSEILPLSLRVCLFCLIILPEVSYASWPAYLSEHLSAKQTLAYEIGLTLEYGTEEEIQETLRHHQYLLDLREESMILQLWLFIRYQNAHLPKTKEDILKAIDTMGRLANSMPSLAYSFDKPHLADRFRNDNGETYREVAEKHNLVYRQIFKQKLHAYDQAWRELESLTGNEPYFRRGKKKYFPLVSDVSEARKSNFRELADKHKGMLQGILNDLKEDKNKSEQTSFIREQLSEEVFRILNNQDTYELELGPLYALLTHTFMMRSISTFFGVHPEVIREDTKLLSSLGKMMEFCHRAKIARQPFDKLLEKLTYGDYSFQRDLYDFHERQGSNTEDQIFLSISNLKKFNLSSVSASHVLPGPYLKRDLSVPLSPNKTWDTTYKLWSFLDRSQDFLNQDIVDPFEIPDPNLLAAGALSTPETLHPVRLWWLTQARLIYFVNSGIYKFDKQEFDRQNELLKKIPKGSIQRVVQHLDQRAFTKMEAFIIELKAATKESRSSVWEKWRNKLSASDLEAISQHKPKFISFMIWVTETYSDHETGVGLASTPELALKLASWVVERGKKEIDQRKIVVNRGGHWNLICRALNDFERAWFASLNFINDVDVRFEFRDPKLPFYHLLPSDEIPKKLSDLISEKDVQQFLKYRWIAYNKGIGSRKALFDLLKETLAIFEFWPIFIDSFEKLSVSDAQSFFLEHNGLNIFQRLHLIDPNSHRIEYQIESIDETYEAGILGISIAKLSQSKSPLDYRLTQFIFENLLKLMDMNEQQTNSLTTFKFEPPLKHLIKSPLRFQYFNILMDRYKGQSYFSSQVIVALLNILDEELYREDPLQNAPLLGSVKELIKKTNVPGQRHISHQAQQVLRHFRKALFSIEGH